MGGSIFDLSDLNDAGSSATEQIPVRAPDNSPGQRSVEPAPTEHREFHIPRIAIFIAAAVVLVAVIALSIFYIQRPADIDPRIPGLPDIQQGGAAAIMMMIVVTIMALMAMAIYAVPTIVAVLRGHRNVAAIVVINLFLGWTLVGWVGALVWAVIVTAPEATNRHL